MRRTPVPKAPVHHAATRRTPTWQTTPDSMVAWGWYVEGVRQATDDLQHATERARAGEGFVWLGLKDPTNEDMTQFATQFHLHPLAIEDAVEGHTRSKLEFFDDTVFAVISTVAYVEHSPKDTAAEIVSTGQIMVFLGQNFVMTVRRGEQSPLRTMRHELEQRPEFLAHGPHVVLYSVYDRVVDDYMQTVAEIEEDMDEAEEAIFGDLASLNLSTVYQLKREVIEFRRCVSPLSLPLNLLSSRDIPLVPEDFRAYFREVADHHTEARESVASFDDVLTNLLQAGLARLSVKDNQDMRKISAAVAILAVPTLVGAVYGMNFTFMPELHWHYGYYFTLALMVVVMAVLYLVFRHNKWL